MAKEKTIFKTTFKVEVLHEEKDALQHLSLEGIISEARDGDFSMGYDIIELGIPLTGKAAVEAVEAQGTDTDFFQMDEEGNEIEEDWSWTNDTLTED